jgi:hypothetical protein
VLELVLCLVPGRAALSRAAVCLAFRVRQRMSA